MKTITSSEVPKAESRTIYVTQAENVKYFDQKIAAFSKGYARIKRLVTYAQDPLEYHGPREYGYIVFGGKKIAVYGDRDMEIEGWFKEETALQRPPKGGDSNPEWERVAAVADLMGLRHAIAKETGGMGIERDAIRVYFGKDTAHHPGRIGEPAMEYEAEIFLSTPDAHVWTLGWEWKEGDRFVSTTTDRQHLKRLGLWMEQFGFARANEINKTMQDFLRRVDRE